MTELVPGHFYWCDTGGENSGFVLLESVVGFTATVTPAGYDNQNGSRFVHADCLSRKGLAKVKKEKGD